MTARPPAYPSKAALAAELSMSETTVDELVKRGVLPTPGPDGLWNWEEVDRRLHNLPRVGTVYVIGFGAYVKIGFTIGDIAWRVAVLQTGAPERLEIYGTLPGSMKTEAELHRRFSEYRSYGEWFRREGALAAWIDGGCKS